MKSQSTILTTAIIAAFSFPLAQEAQAQTSARPTGSYGDVSLTAGFLPDPHMRALTAGGPNQASSFASNCRGYVATTPDYTLYYNAGTMPLVLNADSDADTTLMVRTPDGRIVCDDDGADAPFNPLLRWESPQSGRYDIWVGTYSQHNNSPAVLYISELGEHTRRTASPSGETRSRALDVNADAEFGRVRLDSGFLPDPYIQSLMAGGSIDGDTYIPEPNATCGNISRAPSIELRYSGNESLYIYTSGSTDTTLAIRDPQGNWRCSDDQIGTDAGIRYDGGTRGTYRIYVGTYHSERAPTNLMISELGFVQRERSVGSGGSGIDIHAAPAYGRINLEAGFLPDPHRMNLTAGGNIEASHAIPGSCRGYITGQPSVELNYDGNQDLYIYTDGSADTTLAIRGPNGQWRCSDDELGTDAGLAYENATHGTYDIFVGTYGSNRENTTLLISEISMGHGTR